jgi:hypothetical protein
MRALFTNRSVRPYLLLVVITLVLWALDRGQGRFFTTGTAYSVLQQFATVGPIALGLGLSMIIREFDLSVGGMLSLSGCVAVLSGADYPALGVALAVLCGLAWGLFQGGVMVWLRLGSIGVTLGGLLTATCRSAIRAWTWRWRSIIRCLGFFRCGVWSHSPLSSPPHFSWRAPASGATFMQRAATAALRWSRASAPRSSCRLFLPVRACWRRWQERC